MVKLKDRVVVLVPLSVAAPTVGIFLPPALVVFRAKGPRLREFVAPFLGFGAVRAVLLDGLVNIVIGLAGAFLTLVVAAPDGRGG